MEDIQQIVQEVVRRCATRGVSVSDVLAVFVATTVSDVIERIYVIENDINLVANSDSALKYVTISFAFRSQTDHREIFEGWTAAKQLRSALDRGRIERSY